MASDLRQNPFTKAFAWVDIEEELYRIKEYAHLPGIYGIQLKEIPKPDSVSIIWDDISNL